MIHQTLLPLLINLSLISLSLAAPMVAGDELSATAGGNAWQYGTGGGILSLAVLILDVIFFGMSPSTHSLQILATY